MSALKVIDAIMRLTAEELPEGESILMTKVPGGKMQVLRLAIRSTSLNVDVREGSMLSLEAHLLEEL